MNFKKIWTGIAITAISLSGFVGVGTANAAPPEPTETNAINDYLLKRSLNTQYFGNPADTNITAEQLKTLTEIDIENADYFLPDEEEQKNDNDGSYGYMDISGLRYATNLKTLNISDVYIVPDENKETSKAVYEELNYLTDLESLSIEDTDLGTPVDYGFSDDFTLNLPNLTYLNLRDNHITNSIYFISELNNLEELYLGGNYGYTWDRDAEGTEITLYRLENVKRLDLSYNNFDENDKYLVDSVMGMGSLEWFNFEGNDTKDLRMWKPVADKVNQTSFANQQLRSNSNKIIELDGTIYYDMKFYEQTYYDVDGVEYSLKNNGGLLYEESSEDLFPLFMSDNIPVGEFTGDRTNSGIGQSYDIEDIKNLNYWDDKYLYYGFGNPSTRGSFAFQHGLHIFINIGVLPEHQVVDEEIGAAIETQPLTVVNTDATATYSTTDELPKGLTLDSETGVISGIAEEPFDGIITLIPTFSKNIPNYGDYGGKNTIQITITDSSNVVKPVLSSDLPNGKVGEEYNGSITVDSGVITTVDSLPNGLSYDYETGVVSGVPTVDGEFDLLIEVEKSGETFNFNESLVILPADPEIITPVITSDLPDGKVGDNYDGSIISEPGSITNVDGLPDGLTFDSDTGKVNGVPTKAGEFNVNITADNQGVKNTSVETIVIADVPVDDKPSTEPTPTPVPASEDPTDNTNNTPLDPSPSQKPVDKVDENNVDNNDNLSTPVDKSKTVDKENVNPADKAVKKINSGEIIDEYSLPIFSVLSIMFGLGLLVVILKLRKKNN